MSHVIDIVDVVFSFFCGFHYIRVICNGATSFPYPILIEIQPEIVYRGIKCSKLLPIQWNEASLLYGIVV